MSVLPLCDSSKRALGALDARRFPPAVAATSGPLVPAGRRPRPGPAPAGGRAAGPPSCGVFFLPSSPPRKISGEVVAGLPRPSSTAAGDLPGSPAAPFPYLTRDPCANLCTRLRLPAPRPTPRCLRRSSGRSTTAANHLCGTRQKPAGMCPGAGCAKGADMPSRKSAGVVKLPGGQPQVRRRQRELVEYGRTVLAAEAGVLARMTLDARFATCVEWILTCRGRVVVSGMGKPGFIAQKLSATLASTGTPSHYLHPAEAAHGDLGRVAKEDVVLALSNSGETEEILRLLPALKKIGARVVALTRDHASPLARGADLVLPIGAIEEACPMGLAPTASTAALLALGDALAMTVLKNRPFDREEYALYHPGGKLGRGLMKVREVMRSGEANPLVRDTAPLSRAVAVMTQTPGRPGACSVVDGEGNLVGMFTDGDLRRIVERGRVEFDAPVSRVMSRNPRTVRPEALVADAARVLRQARIDQVPVVDDEGRAVGLLDVQDLLAARVL